MPSLGAPSSGINEAIIYCTCRTKTEFSDRFQKKIKFSGTGFWVNLKGKLAFVTNKHNVDPNLALEPYSGYILSRFEIELRRIESGAATSETAFFDVSNTDDCTFSSDSADCAVLFTPTFQQHNINFLPISIGAQEIADANWLSKNVRLMDYASFIGFPGNRDVAWWDEEWNLPVARLASISSLPGRPFINQGISTGDVTLVSGLSFGGSSGSPVVSHEKPSIPPKLIGIMSGHWQEENQQPNITRHSGLSYHTRSTSIWDVFDKILSKNKSP